MPYGVCRNSQGNLDTDKLFTGQRLDDTSLYFYNARYYDATIGRFISADTVVQDPTNPQSLNRYSYCLNNPLKYTDPSGHFLDAIVDFFSLLWDIGQCIVDPGDATNWAALGADAGCLLIPGATGGGAAVRAADKISDATRAFNKGSDAIQFANRGGDAAQFANRGGDALRSGDGATTAIKFDKHHPIPKFLGGNKNQPLITIPRPAHHEFNSLLSKNLKDAGFPNVGGRGGSTEDWATYFETYSGTQQKALDVVLDTSRTIDYKYGTNIADALQRNMDDILYKVIP